MAVSLKTSRYQRRMRFGLDFLAEQALEAVAEFLGGPAEVRFENLSDVHTRRNAERIENDFHGSAIREGKAYLLPERRGR